MTNAAMRETTRRRDRLGVDMKKPGYYKYILLTTVLFCIIAACIPVQAQGEQDLGRSVVVLLDTSGSMKTNDPEKQVPDSMAQLVCSLPADYEVGAVTYGTNAALLAERADSSRRDDLVKSIENVEYRGYSNAGDGLDHAIAALAGTTAKEKYIVLFSDGEILLKDEADTERSREQYQDAVELAREQGIVIYVIGLGEDMEDLDNDIFKAAAATGGKSWHIAETERLQGAIDAVREEMGVRQSVVAIVNAGDDQEKVTVELPYLQADRIKVLLTYSAPVRSLNSAFQAESARQINGGGYSLLEIERPTGGHLETSFETEAGNQVRIDAIAEYSVVPDVEVSYEDRLVEGEGIAHYERTAILSCSFYSAVRPGVVLWEDACFNHCRIALEIDGETEECELLSGKLELQRSVSRAEQCEIVFDYSALPANVTGESSVTVSLEAPPTVPAEESQEPEETGLSMDAAAVGLVLLSLLAAVIILALCLRRPKPAPVPRQQPQPSKYSYVGKVNLYITRTRSGYDVPPLYYDLFRLPAGKVISLQEILRECEVTEEFPGAGDIYFKPGTNRSLILTNNSDCTIMKSREILMKNKSYQLAPDAKLDISFEDEISEMTLQYRNLKPSETWR